MQLHAHNISSRVEIFLIGRVRRGWCECHRQPRSLSAPLCNHLILWKSTIADESRNLVFQVQTLILVVTYLTVVSTVLVRVPSSCFPSHWLMESVVLSIVCGQVDLLDVYYEGVVGVIGLGPRGRKTFVPSASVIVSRLLLLLLKNLGLSRSGLFSGFLRLVFLGFEIGRFYIFCLRSVHIVPCSGEKLYIQLLGLEPGVEPEI